MRSDWSIYTIEKLKEYEKSLKDNIETSIHIMGEIAHELAKREIKKEKE